MSFRLVDKIKKSNLPGPLKKVLEAYVSFGNSDGTSIRPTADKVAERAGCGQRTVQRHTPTIVNLGLLVHERDEHGNYLTYSYPKDGVWAYVYHADLSPLANPAVVEGFERKRQAVKDARRRAQKNGSRSRQLELFENDKMADSPHDRMAQTPYAKLAETPDDKMADRPDPCTPLRFIQENHQTQTDPSAVSTAVSEKESEQVSPSANLAAPLASLEEPQGTSSPAPPTPSGHAGLKPETKVQQGHSGSGPHTAQELYDDYFGTEEMILLLKITPIPTDAMVRDHYSICSRILSFFDTDTAEHRVLAAEKVMEWNRAHRSHKYASKEDKLYYLRTAPQYLKALEAGNLLNSYETHDFENCEICEAAGIGMHYRELLRRMAEKERERENRKREEERGKTIPTTAPTAAPILFDFSPVSNEEAASLGAWLKERGKVGDWSFGKEDSRRLGVGDNHVAAVLRHMRQNGTAVTKEQFIDLLVECAERRTLAAYDVL